METPNYYAIIPADVRYDNRLSMLERLLYGEITALSQKTGECWATNAYFAGLYEKQPNSISHNISNLAKFGYIEISVDQKGGNRRGISIIINRDTSNDKSRYPVKTNPKTPVPISPHTPNLCEPYESEDTAPFLEPNNTSINNTSLKEEESPYPLFSGEKAGLFSSPSSEALKKASTLNCSKGEPVRIRPPSKEDDEGFNLFITAYPGQGRFITALEIWHRKRAMGRLPAVEEILRAVEEQKLYRFTDPEGKYIPNPARWLEEEEWRYVVDPAVKASIGARNKERREEEFREMYIKGFSTEELGAFARKHKIRPDLYPPLTREATKYE